MNIKLFKTALLESAVALALSVSGAKTAALASSMDTTCQALKNAQASLRNTPFHMYMTTEDKFSNGKLAKAAASLDMAGIKKSEEIWTGKDVYVLNNGKWIDMQISFAEMQKKREVDKDDLDNKKAREAEECKTLPDETVFGQPATVYQDLNPELSTNTKIWVSKSTHVPVKSEVVDRSGAMTSFMSARYEYGNVQAPANAVSMQEMIKSRMHK